MTTETLFIWSSIMAKEIKTVEVSQEQAQQIIKGYKGRQFFTVEFVKRTNGENRVMNCRKGVSKGVRGGGLRFDPVSKGLVNVFDIPLGQHRFISLDTIKRISLKGKRYIVIS